MNDLDDNSGLNFSKLLPTSINEQISELVDGSSNPNAFKAASTNDSSTFLDPDSEKLTDSDEISLVKPHIGTIEEKKPEDVWNRHILTGYRINHLTWKSILMSLFKWHNETINIWTHLVGFVVFLIILLVLSIS